MFFSIQLSDPRPVYQQLADQVKQAVATGRLHEGDRLPAIRDLAVELRVNRNTVARVYADLEREGILDTRAGQGAFISSRGSGLSRAEQRRRLTARLDEILADARLYGLTREQTEQIIADRLDRYFRTGARAAAGGTPE